MEIIGRRDLLEHDLILQQITNLTGEPTTDCYLPEDQLETTYAEQLGENAEVVDRRVANISMKGQAFREHISRSIARARDIASRHS